MKLSVSPETLLASGDYLAIVRDFALSKGIGPSVLLKDTNIALEDLINPPKLINNLIFNHVGVNLYHQLQNPLAEAIEFGLSMTAASHGSLGIAVQCATNLAAALKVLVDFFNTRINAQDIKLREDKQFIKAYLICKYDDPDTEEQVQHFFDLSALISIAVNMQHALDMSHLEGEIIMHIDKPEPNNFPYDLLAGKVKVLFDQQALELCIPKSWMDSPLNISNPELAKAALEKCADELKVLSPLDLVSQVKKRIRNAASNIPKIDDIAQEFHMSEATFKRHLKKQHTSYQQLKNTERLELAKSLILEGKSSLETISSLLGFSDASNFTKAFKTWTGVSPKQFRETN